MRKIEEKLRAILALTGWNQQQAAERFGVSQSTVNRWLTTSEPEGQNRDKIDELYRELVENDSGAPDANQDDPGLEVVGTIEAGNFRDITLEDQDGDRPRIPVMRIPKFAHARQYALLVSGDSMNELYPDGSYVICVDLEDSGIKLRPGLRVHIERNMFNHHVETTLKEIQSIDGKAVLVPRSTNPRHKPIEVHVRRDAEVRIRGVVIGGWINEEI